MDKSSEALKIKYTDLSHTIDNEVVSYKGLPAPVICDYLSRENSKAFYADGTEFQIGRIDMVSNTGTYIDCPFHRFENGKDLSEVELEKFVDIPAIKITVPFQKSLAVTTDHFKNLDLTGKAVLIQTGWDKYWNTDKYYENHPFLTEDAANYLKDQGIVLAGIDSHNIDDTRQKSRPVHTILLGAEILIVEHLCNLDSVLSQDFFFSAVPPKVKGMGTFPVRAMAKEML